MEDFIALISRPVHARGVAQEHHGKGKTKMKNLCVFILPVLMIFSFTGCGWNVTFRPTSPTDSVAASVESLAPKYSAIILGGSMKTYDGGNLDPNNAFKEVIAYNLRQTGIFKTVDTIDPALSANEKASVTFTSTQTYNWNAALGGVKGFLVGASLFLLAPVIPFYADASTNFVVRVQKPDGSSRDYNGTVTGDMRAFFFSVKSGTSDLLIQVHFQALQDVIKKMTNDRGWLQK